MEPNYGRRKDDLMSEDLQAANLTDSQKVNIKIIQNLTSLNTAINDLRHDVSEHDKILVRGNGEPSMQERLRNVESFIGALRYWGRFIGGALVLQTLGGIIGLVLVLVRVLPVLEKLAHP